MNPLRSLVGLLVFPGLLYALPMSWLMLGLERKLKARFQGRIGPPLSQPFYDVVKLLAKAPVARVAADARILAALPVLAVGSMLGTLALLPVFAGQIGFAGDLILFVSLLELPPLCLVLAGYASRSIYGQVGATREAVIGIASNVPFLAALVAMATAAGSLRLGDIALATPWSVRVPALLAILFCLRAAPRPVGAGARARVGRARRLRGHPRHPRAQPALARRHAGLRAPLAGPRATVRAHRLGHGAAQARPGDAHALARGVAGGGGGARPRAVDPPWRALTCPRS